VTPFPAEFAADGIDELIMGFFGHREQPVADGQRTLRVVAADAGADWLVTMAADGSDVASVERGSARGSDSSAGDPDATVTGPASDLYLLLWNRSPAGDGDVSVAGDADLLKSWPERMHVTWT
jgi:MDMPI C-terminal domain